MRRANIDWQAGAHFRAAVRDATIDVAPPDEGVEGASGAKELVLAGLGCCTALDVISILEKMRQPVETFRVEVEADEADEHPKALTAFRLHYVLSGDGLDPRKVARAVWLSDERYCGVSATLRKGADITTRIFVNGAEVEHAREEDLHV